MGMENIGVTDVTWKRQETNCINFILNLSSNTELVINISGQVPHGNMKLQFYNQLLILKTTALKKLLHVIVRD